MCIRDSIKALKVIEEAGIPIDYIAGTSMGAIVGGLYAIGYTTEQLDSMVRKQTFAGTLCILIEYIHFFFCISLCQDKMCIRDRLWDNWGDPMEKLWCLYGETTVSLRRNCSVPP